MPTSQEADAARAFRECASYRSGNRIHGDVSTVKKPSLGAVIIGLIPYAAMCFSVSWWDRIDPMVLGLPFNLFWLTSWVVLSPACMAVAYRLETRRGRETSARQEDRTK